MKEDPDLAVAHIRLAWSLRSTAEAFEEFSHHLQRAFQLADKSTEVDRRWILGSYYDLQGEPDRAAEHYEILLTSNPNHYAALNNLTAYWNQRAHRHAQRIAKVLQYSARRAELRHNSATIQASCAWLSAYWGDLPQAQKFVDRTRELLSMGAELNGYQASWIELFPAYRQWLAGNPETALLEVDRVAQMLESLPGDKVAHFTWMVAIAYQAMGRLKSGEQLLERIRGAPQVRVSLPLVASAVVWEDKKALRQELEYDLDRPSHTSVILLARLGLASQAEEAREKVLARYRVSKETEALLRGTIRIMEGAVALAAGKTSEAIDVLEEGASGGGYRSPVSLAAESLAQVWLEQGRTEKALGVLERNSHNLEKVHAAFNWGPAPLYWMRLRLQLANLYRQTGRDDEARKVEAELSKLLSHADSDHPFLIALAQNAEEPAKGTQETTLLAR